MTDTKYFFYLAPEYELMDRDHMAYTFVPCQRCYAVVHWSNREDHIKWHDKLSDTDD